jgi:tRNA A-37 threonylcarbamoyl transferase component Bud32
VVGDEAPEPGEFRTGERVAEYRLGEILGRGGMAAVYRAYDERLGRNVALKILAPRFARDEAFRQRFIRESRAAAGIDHPNIIPIFGAGEVDGVLFIAMRLVHGSDVQTLIQERGPLAVAQACHILTQVAAALDAAHQQGLVHRDVKPANMLREASPGDGRPDHIYLSDFGVSKHWLSSSHLTATGEFLGTMDYIAPEQIAGRPVDGRSDQYALACSAFEMLTGAPPFQQDATMAVMWAQVSTTPPALTSRRPGLPAEADQVMAKALAKDPADRYRTCSEFASVLHHSCTRGRGTVIGRSPVRDATQAVGIADLIAAGVIDEAAPGAASDSPVSEPPAARMPLDQASVHPAVRQPPSPGTVGVPGAVPHDATQAIGVVEAAQEAGVPGREAGVDSPPGPGESTEMMSAANLAAPGTFTDPQALGSDPAGSRLPEDQPPAAAAPPSPALSVMGVPAASPEATELIDAAETAVAAAMPQPGGPASPESRAGSSPGRPEPLSPPGRPRRLSRKAKAAIIIPLALLALLVGVDRLAAAYAANQIATKIQKYGFPVKPGVTVEGFPFLTQIISRHLDGVDISAPNFPVGPVTASMQVQATDIALNSGYKSGTIAHVTGSGLISFSSLSRLAGVEGAPGLKVSRDSAHKVKLTANLQILTATAVARVKKTGRNRFSIDLISANGIPVSLLRPIRHLVVHIPKLPQGLTVQAVSVTDQGVVVQVAGSHVSFGNRPPH